MIISTTPTLEGNFFAGRSNSYEGDLIQARQNAIT